jgi:hypothetical protein
MSVGMASSPTSPILGRDFIQNNLTTKYTKYTKAKGLSEFSFFVWFVYFVVQKIVRKKAATSQCEIAAVMQKLLLDQIRDE